MMNKYPTSFQAVDVIILDKKADFNNLLLGRKLSQEKWRFIGGFVDPKDNSLEEAAIRELGEEVKGIGSYGAAKYEGSFRVDDPRYRDSVDKIMSAVFLVRISQFKELFGGDDIFEVKWYDLKHLYENYKQIIVPEHFPIIEKFISNFRPFYNT